MLGLSRASMRSHAFQEGRQKLSKRTAASFSSRTALRGREMRIHLARRFGWLCWYCSTTLTPDTATIDHIVPWSQRGGHDVANLALACAGCNWAKMDRTLDEFLDWLDFVRCHQTLLPRPLQVPDIPLLPVGTGRKRKSHYRKPKSCRLTYAKGKCVECNQRFTAAKPWQKFCSDECRIVNWKLRKELPVSEAVQQKLFGKGLAGDRYAEALSHAKATALVLAARGDIITIEHVRHEMTQRGHYWPEGNWPGSVFDGVEWEQHGYTNATRKEAHARVLRTWRLKGVAA